MCILVTSTHSHHSEVTAPAGFFFCPFPAILEGWRSSCKWWFKLPIAPNCHPAVYETHLWQWISGTMLQLLVSLTVHSEPDWSGVSYTTDCHTVFESISLSWTQPTTFFCYFMQWQLWPIVSRMLTSPERVYFYFSVWWLVKWVWLEQEGLHLGSKSLMITNADVEQWWASVKQIKCWLNRQEQMYTFTSTRYNALHSVSIWAFFPSYLFFVFHFLERLHF